jgi:tetratricopeptide (TPR) repeat protein
MNNPPTHLPVRRWPCAWATRLPPGRPGGQGRAQRRLLRPPARTTGDAYLWYQLGKDHDVYERWAEAVDAFDQAEPAGRRGAAWLHDLSVRRLHALKRCGRHAEAFEQARQGLERWQQSPDFFFALGDLLLDWAAEQPTLAPELIPMIEDAWQRCLALGEHPELEGAVRGRGSHLAAGNLALLYDLVGRPADAAHCRQLAAQR